LIYQTSSKTSKEWWEKMTHCITTKFNIISWWNRIRRAKRNEMSQIHEYNYWFNVECKLRKIALFISILLIFIQSNSGSNRSSAISTVYLLWNLTREVLELFTLLGFRLLVVSTDLSETHETIKMHSYSWVYFSQSLYHTNDGFIVLARLYLWREEPGTWTLLELGLEMCGTKFFWSR
jgi:hypothetical protein